MSIRQCFAVAIVIGVVSCLAACDRSARTYIEVSVEGIEYRVSSGVLFLQDLPNGETFVDLRPDMRRTSLVTGVPHVQLQWRMPLPEPVALVGRSIDLSDPNLQALVSFRFTEDFAVVSLERPPRVTVDVDRIDGRVVLGRVLAEGFVDVASDDEPPHPLRIEGRFRVLLDAP